MRRAHLHAFMCPGCHDDEGGALISAMGALISAMGALISAMGALISAMGGAHFCCFYAPGWLVRFAVK